MVSLRESKGAGAIQPRQPKLEIEFERRWNFCCHITESNVSVPAVVRVVRRIMNVFRLVLCLAGLAVYLLAKQFLPSTEVSPPSPGASVPSATTRVPVISSTAEAPGAITINEPRAGVRTARPGVVGMPKSVPN